MNNKIRHIFIFVFIFSVFSLTLQASIIQVCKESKVFKNQNQQSPITEEEEKAHSGDDVPDEETVYINSNHHLHHSDNVSLLFWDNSDLNCCSSAIEILIPPPKF